MESGELMMQTGRQKSLPAIMHEQDYDESFILGSANEIKAFALAILEALEGAKDSKNYLCVECKLTKFPNTDSWGETRITGLVITNTENDKRKLINAIRKNNGVEQISADGWPVIE